VGYSSRRTHHLGADCGAGSEGSEGRTEIILYSLRELGGVIFLYRGQAVADDCPERMRKEDITNFDQGRSCYGEVFS
jgi:hypothetical protein